MISFIAIMIILSIIVIGALLVTLIGGVTGGLLVIDVIVCIFVIYCIFKAIKG